MNTSISAHRDHKMIRRLASALCMIYSIPFGDQMVILIGNGEESDNQHAMETWIIYTLEQVDKPYSKEVLPYLVSP